MRFNTAQKLLFLGILFYSLAAAGQPASLSRIFDFEDAESNAQVVLTQTGDNPGPALENGYLTLLQGGWGHNHRNSALFPAVTSQLYENIRITFRLYITRGAEGCGIVLLNTDLFPEDSLATDGIFWAGPDLVGSFALGFDIHNPPTAHWFDANGNFYDRPQREISLHWNGQERHKLMSPLEYRADPEQDDEGHDFQLQIRYETGGAMISLFMDKAGLIEDYFMPGMHPSPHRLLVGAQTAETTSTVILDDIGITYENPLPEPEEPVRVPVIQSQPIHIETRDTSHPVVFPEFTGNIGRVILGLQLSDLAGGYDPWDKGAAIYIWDDSVRYEICRFITPYNRGFTWYADVTDYLPLFRGEKVINLHVDTWMQKESDPALQKGWAANVNLDFYPGTSSRKPFLVQNIWNGFYEYGNPADPLQQYLTRQEITIPAGATSARLRLTVTGHGMHPNTGNAAEFLPASRTVKINESTFTNLLWKTDCYLNPCRPQDGTWKFDRAGWAPGSIVQPWIIEIPADAIEAGHLNLEYLPLPYLNTSEGDHYRAHHWFESQLIFFRNP